MGSQKNISMSGVNPPIDIFRQDDNAGEQYDDIDLVGYTCIEGDVLFKGYSGKLIPGALVVISNCGSYSIVMKPPFIMLNFPVLDICGDKVEVIKAAEQFEDVFSHYAYI